MSPLKLVLLALALVLPGGSLLLVAMAALQWIRARRPALLAKLEPPKPLPPAGPDAP
jgi:hypothetical protein